MKNLIIAIKRFSADEEGSALVEYSILLGILIVGLIAIISTFGDWITGQWNTVCKEIDAAERTRAASAAIDSVGKGRSCQLGSGRHS